MNIYIYMGIFFLRFFFLGRSYIGEERREVGGVC